jgi:hypothetical protein
MVFLSHNITGISGETPRNQVNFSSGQERQRRLDLRLSRKLQQEKKIEDRLKERHDMTL